MKKNLKFAIVSALALAAVACGQETTAPVTQDDIKAQMKLKHYALTPDEANLAQANAKSYFGQEWVDAANKRGMFVYCKPTDSNKNGKVTCSGKIPNPPNGATYRDTDMYCYYIEGVNGCSNKDD
ncbi:hypothetical protein [Methyloversatilis sp.]|uniref:hypothetical protein n=1 Tax=Methyloversatilis sp. TaxID=2569862 RepID=UPI0035B3E91F